MRLIDTGYDDTPDRSSTFSNPDARGGDRPNAMPLPLFEQQSDRLQATKNDRSRVRGAIAALLVSQAIAPVMSACQSAEGLSRKQAID